MISRHPANRASSPKMWCKHFHTSQFDCHEQERQLRKYGNFRKENQIFRAAMWWKKDWKIVIEKKQAQNSFCLLSCAHFIWWYHAPICGIASAWCLSFIKLPCSKISSFTFYYSKKNLHAINNTSSSQVQLHQFNLTKVQLRRVIEMETMAQLKLNLAGAQKQGQRLRALHKNSLWHESGLFAPL